MWGGGPGTALGGMEWMDGWMGAPKSPTLPTGRATAPLGDPGGGGCPPSPLPQVSLGPLLCVLWQQNREQFPPLTSISPGLDPPKKSWGDADTGDPLILGTEIKLQLCPVYQTGDLRSEQKVVRASGSPPVLFHRAIWAVRLRPRLGASGKNKRSGQPITFCLLACLLFLLM